MTTAVVLGSAQDGGVPQFGGPHRPPRVVRTAASLCLVEHDGSALLIDAGPDLRVQQRRLLANRAYRSRRSREPFDGIVLTHAHMGHYAGLVHFGREAHASRGVPLWATPAMLAYLGANSPWSRLFDDGNVVGRPVEPGDSFSPWPGLEMRLPAVPHRAEFTDTVAVSVGSALLYVPDIDAWDQWGDAHREVAGHAISLLDGTFFSSDELPHRSMAEVAHPLMPDTMEVFADLAGERRLIFTHLNHTNAASEPGPARRRVRERGFEVAGEMLALVL